MIFRTPAATCTLFRVIPAVAVLILAAGEAWSQVNTKGETNCHSAMTKAIGKHAAATAKAMAACVDAVLDGSSAGPCPDTKAQQAIDKSAAKVLKTTTKKCQSFCSPSGVPCIGGAQCPPLDGLVEGCTAGGKNSFESARMGFPGAFCESLVGDTFRDPEHFGECAIGLGATVSAQLLSNAYGDVDGTPPLTPEAAKCLASIVKTTSKTAARLASTVSKCRISMLGSATPEIAPEECPTAHAKTADAISKGLAKVAGAIAKSCSDSTVQELDLCGEGLGAVTSVASAQACLSDMVGEVAFGGDDAESRVYATVSIINAAFPSTAPARCGDNVVNQLPSQFLLIGEECDGTDDAECPGQCAPPGDVFECTCTNVLRMRSFAVGVLVDVDSGWTGSSHNAPGTEGTGALSTLTDCDCSAFGVTPSDAATCVGASSDPACELFAETLPRCASRVGDGTSCDEVGTQDGNHDNGDCKACDAFAANAGDYCTGTARSCLGGGNDGLRCNQPSDCPGGACAGLGQCLDGPRAGEGCTTVQDCGICVGGSNNGGTCSISSHCPLGACETHSCATNECIGGTNSGDPCVSGAQCSGGRCAKTSDCLSQCYDADDNAQGPCWQQSDCGEGQRCRGRCNSDDYCIFRYNSAPLPLVGGGIGTCVLSEYTTNITGFRNIVTGEAETNFDLRSVVYLAQQLNSRPCPVCGGFCDTNGGSLAGAVCQGNCTGPEKECRFGPNLGAVCADDTDCNGFPCAAVGCRFDSDCPSGTCSEPDSPECGGGTCRLDLTCAGGPNDGEACRIESLTSLGATSPDCPPDIGSNISGTGLKISWTPLTTETVAHDPPTACDAPGYSNFDCSCADGSGSVRSRPNSCSGACTDPDPAFFARPCASLSTCVGGLENGVACDEDSDCSGGGLCSGDPMTCTAGSTGSCTVRRCNAGSNAGGRCAVNSQCPGGLCAAPACTVGDLLACSSGADGACSPPSCSSNGDCGGGSTCADTCPNGRCEPLCVVRGECDGGDRAGLGCVLDSDCAAGGVCIAGDPEEGACASGATYHCDGAGREFLGCLASDVGTKKNCEFGADNIDGNADDFPGAGTCVQDVSNCFVNGGAAEGGDIFNGDGDATVSRQVTAYCIPATGSASVDGTAGLPGPGRVRSTLINVMNISATP